MQTAATQDWKIGGFGLLSIEKLSIPVRIEDGRNVWGRTDLLVTPVDGTGTQWVSLDRVDLTGHNPTYGIAQSKGTRPIDQICYTHN